MKKILAISAMLSMFGSSNIHAQNNPFPQNKTYSYGLMPSNKNSSDASSAYAIWKTNFLAPCNNGRYRVKFDNPSQTVSEGIGYGMLLSAYAGDKSVFDGLWLFYKDFNNSHGVMHWKIDGCTGISGQNGATDSEVDAAMALIVASYQWASTGSINYNSDAKSLISSIKNYEVESGTSVLKPGDMFGGSNLTNPSYFAPGYFRAFGQFTNDASFWNGVAAKTYQVINANLSSHNAVGGLVSDWTRADGSYSSDAGGYVNGGTKYTYDAARTPWRIAVDYVWYGTTEAKTYSQKSSDFVRVNLGGTKNIKDGYNQNGTASGQWHNSTFVGAFAAAAMGGGNQIHLNDSYSDLNGINDASSYFNQTLKTLYLYLLTGNFYLPGISGSTPTPTPTNISPTVSLTSPSNNTTYSAPANVNLSANASDANGTISKVEFYNGTTKLGEDLSSPYTYSWTGVGAGTYAITAKATDNAGSVTTSNSANITITSTPTPSATLSPFSGTPTSIPGRIEAEKYDLGGSGVAYSDADAANSGAQFRNDGVDIEATIDAGSGYNIGWTAAGEWLKYSVNVSSSGKYDLKVRVASGAAGKSFHIEMNGTNISGSISVPNTGGWQTWQTITIPGLNLTQGNQVMRVYFDTDGINLNYVEFGTAVSSVPSNPANSAPTVSITSPANNSSFTAGTPIQVNASASDKDGSVSKVEFFQGSTKLGEDLSSPYSYTISGLTAGTYSLTAKATDNAGASTTSAVVSITVNATTTPTPTPTGCATQALPPASQFVVRNSWSDNTNGSGVSDASNGLKITHRAWGNSTLWVIQSGKQTAITSGKEYTLSFDVLNDAVNPVSGINAAFASNYDGNGPILSQPAVSVPSGFSSSAFTTKSVKITASSTGNVYLTLNINWPGQPNATTNLIVKNLSVCESSTSATQARMAAVDNLSVFPNPFNDVSTVYVASDLNVAMVVEISDMFGNVRATIPSYTNQNVVIGNQLASGSYVVKTTFGGMVLTKSIIKN
ncbi:MAG: carbohydrate-binding protein [Opitutaceae bacterium]|nr:carbohydrate-binding protein [Cytophagales bacterium]